MMKERISVLEAAVEDLVNRVRTLERCEPKPTIRLGEYVTRDGNRAVVYTVTGLDPEFPVVGEVMEEDGPSNHCWTWDGYYHSDRIPFHLDLFEA